MLLRYHAYESMVLGLVSKIIVNSLHFSFVSTSNAPKDSSINKLRLVGIGRARSTRFSIPPKLRGSSLVIHNPNFQARSTIALRSFDGYQCFRSIFEILIDDTRENRILLDTTPYPLRSGNRRLSMITFHALAG